MMLADISDGGCGIMHGAGSVAGRWAMLGRKKPSVLLYQHADQLTTREATDNFGNVAYQRGNFPYGDMWYDTGAASASVKRKFTTYKYEAELSGSLNYAMAREHSARLGRFHMPDPVQHVKRHNPQLLNRYAYVIGDPINFRDPTGRVPWWFPCTQDYWPGFSPFGGIYWPDLDDPACQRYYQAQELASECDPTDPASCAPQCSPLDPTCGLGINRCFAQLQDCIDKANKRFDSCLESASNFQENCDKLCDYGCKFLPPPEKEECELNCKLSCLSTYATWVTACGTEFATRYTVCWLNYSVCTVR
jgi:RHS repeat-associated protein